MYRLRFIPLVLLLATATRAAEVTNADGNTVIRAPAGKSEIVMTTTERLAGAIHSLTWNGKEFIDSADHGRQLQSAVNANWGRELRNETYNPTEAGSRLDGAGPRSSSRLRAISAHGGELRSTIQMAFWLAPGEKSGDFAAYNDRVLSEHFVTKRVHLGHNELSQAIEYDVTFTLPAGEHHTHVVFESLTGYMPYEFSKFWKYDAASQQLLPLDDGPGEQPAPVVLSTDDGSYAMGIYSPDQPAPGFALVGYGRFRFTSDRVTKWNCVFRVTNPQGVPPDYYSFRHIVKVGTLDDVRAMQAAVHDEFAKR
ncbi:MAG TPA: hypothetical protein VHZ24_10685 [Pirellulales bacterium]|nr:hypothetical protein [Pirellulales bacterium]